MVAQYEVMSKILFNMRILVLQLHMCILIIFNIVSVATASDKTLAIYNIVLKVNLRNL